MPDSVILRRLWEELKPMPDRAAATFRITAATLLVVVVMLIFRNKFLDLGPLLVLILMQRNTMMTRLLSVYVIVAVAFSCLVVYGVAVIAWDIAWLRILLWVVIFWIGYFLMSRYKALSSTIVIPLVFISLLCFYFDEYPAPNYILSQVGWVWAALGLSLAATMLVQMAVQRTHRTGSASPGIPLDPAPSRSCCRAGGRQEPLLLGDAQRRQHL